MKSGEEKRREALGIEKFRRILWKILQRKKPVFYKKPAEFPSVGNNPEKYREPPEISQEEQLPRFTARKCAAKRGSCLRPLAGCNAQILFRYRFS